jgi:hypothetical protein
MKDANEHWTEPERYIVSVLIRLIARRALDEESRSQSRPQLRTQQQTIATMWMETGWSRVGGCNRVTLPSK